MPTIAFFKAGQLGIIKDLPPEELPPGAWSDGDNVRFQDGKIMRAPGAGQVFGTPSATPYWLMPVHTNTEVFWVYSSLTALYATDGTTHDNVTRAVGGAYTVNTDRLWSGGILSGIPVITNGIDVPQYWATPALGNNFADLANWPASTFCDVIKPFKNFLVAMSVTKGGVKYGQLVKWSAPAVPGAVPGSWNEADPTSLAGEVELGEDTPGLIQDGLTLRDTFIIYKDNSVWGMQFIGGQSIFRFFPIFTQSGILTNHCVKSIRKGTMHIVATGDDIVVHDGQNIDSILDKRWKKHIAATISSVNYQKSFMTINYARDEAWFCYPTDSSTITTAVVWNWVDNTITERELPAGTFFIDTGPVASAGGEAWDSSSGTWDTDTAVWDVLLYRPHFFNLLGANITATELQYIDDPAQTTLDGTNYTSFVERTGIALVGQDRVSGEFKADYQSRKICRRVWIKASGAPFYVQVGSQETNVDDPVTYQTAQLFTPGTTKYLDWTANGRYLAIKFYSESGAAWTLEGFDMEIEVLGGL